MRCWAAWTVVAALAIAAPATRLHAEGNGGSYLHWSGEQARRIGEAARVAGRVGRALDLRGLHTDRAYGDSPSPPSQ